MISNLKLLWQRGAFHIIIGNFLTKFLVFFGSILLVRSLPKSSFGELTYIENVYGYIYIFAGLGLANGILRFLVLANKEEEKYSYYKYILERGTIYNVLLILFTTLIILSISNIESDLNKLLLIIYLVGLPFQFIIDMNFYTLRAKLANSLFAIFTLIFSVLTIYGKYISSIFYDINGVIFYTVFINIGFAIFLFIIIKRKYFSKIIPNKLSINEKKVLSKYSLQYMLTNGIWVLFLLNDIFLLNYFLNDSEALAEYKVAFVLPANLAIISSAIGIFVAPYFIKKENDKTWVFRNYIKLLTITSFLMGLISLILFLFAEKILILLFGLDYGNIANLMKLLLISSVINNVFRFTTANLLASMGKIQVNMYISIFGIIIQLILNIILIPTYGLYGAAYTSIIVYSIMALAIILFFIKLYKPNKI